jgi:hypothetical protein
MMKRLGVLSLVTVASLLLLVQLQTRPAAAKNRNLAPTAKAEATKGKPSAKAGDDSDINAEAMAALTSMGTYLRSLKAFQVTAVVTKDDVLDDGELIQFDTNVNLLARMPDRLRVEVTSVRQHRLYFYNGTEFTLYAQRVNYYATVPAPATVGKLADVLDDKYGIQLPLEDLFYWGGPQSKISEIKGAIDVGPTEVGGVTCEQYAFRQPGLNWQIWIQQGEFPLPRKLVISTLTDEARPQYSSVLNWNLAPSFNDAAFTFDPPSDAQKIVFATANAADGAGK